jgi:Tol biopolymer transport system component
VKTLVVATPFSENNARFSSDGRWVAYQSDETGRTEVYIQSFPEGGEKRQVSNGRGGLPRWRRDGREIYYASRTHLMAVEVKMNPALEIGAAKTLFQFTTSGARGYDVSADGNRSS